jgi:ATP-dependent helicase HrpB
MDRLPVDAVDGPFREALRAGPVVLTAPTGSGKSTRVPLWCAEERGPTLVVEPRRVACRSLARFVAAGRNTPLGAEIGYVVRHDDRAGPDARVVFVTPGIALRMLVQGALDRFPAVVLDEFHERSLDIDLLLALLAERPAVRLVVMSATVAAERIARFLEGVHLHAEGRAFPVEVEYVGDPLLPSDDDLGRRVAAAVDRMRVHEGDILVFLPGKGEIAECAAALAGLRDLDVLELHGELPAEGQDRAFDPGDRRRVILATNVAETSVTLPRIGVVIDSGLVRRTRYRGARGYLTLAAVAEDSAEQRRGRAGRLFPGRCLRLWGREAILEPTTPPEIHREALPTVVLAAAASGRRASGLRFLDPPRPHAIEAAECELAAMGAIDPEGRITPVGRDLAGLPVDPFLGRILVEARDTPVIADAIDLVATVAAAGRLFLPGPRPADPADDLRAADCDAAARIAAVRRGEPARHRLHPQALAEARRIAGQLGRLLGAPEPRRDRGTDREALARAILRAHPGAAFVPRRRKREICWANGRGEELALGRDTAVREDVEAIAVVDTVAVDVRPNRGVRVVTCAIPCSAATLRAAGLGEIRVAKASVAGGRIVAELIRSHAGLVLERTEEVPRGAAARAAVVKLILDGAIFRGTLAAARDRVAARNLWARLEGSGEPIDLEAWLADRVEALEVDSGEDLPLLRPDDFVIDDLPPDARARLDRHFPRAVSVGDARYAADYDPASMEITLVRVGGTRDTPPPPQYLPAWPGWRVLLKDRSRVRVVREA